MLRKFAQGKCVIFVDVSDRAVCGHSLAGIVGSNSAGGGARMYVSLECCMSSGTGLCVGLITCPEES